MFCHAQVSALPGRSGSHLVLQQQPFRPNVDMACASGRSCSYQSAWAEEDRDRGHAWAMTCSRHAQKQTASAASDPCSSGTPTENCRPAPSMGAERASHGSQRATNAARKAWRRAAAKVLKKKAVRARIMQPKCLLPLEQERKLTTSISTSCTWREAACLFAEHQCRMSCVHISAMLTRLVLLQGLTTPSVISTMQHARFSRSKARSQEEGAAGVGGLQRHDVSGADLSSADRQDLLLTSAGPGRSFDVASSDQRSSSSRQISCSIHGDASSYAGGCAYEDVAARRFPTLQHLVCAVAKEAEARVQHMGMHELSSVLLSLQRLRYPTDKPTVIRFMTQAYLVMARSSGTAERQQGTGQPDVTAQGLVGLITAITSARISRLRRDWATRFLACVDAHHRDLTAQGIALLLRSLAALQQLPPPELRERLFERLVQLAEAGGKGEPVGRSCVQCTPLDVSMTIKALAVLRTQPPAGLSNSLLLATQHLLQSFTASELSGLIWGLAKLRLQPASEHWCADFCGAVTEAVLRVRQPACRPAHSTVVWLQDASKALSVILHSMALLRLQPDEAWLSSCMQFVSRHWSSFTPQGLCSLVYGLALMGFHPGQSFMLCFHRYVEACKDMHPACVTMVRKAYALLNFAPTAAPGKVATTATVAPAAPTRPPPALRVPPESLMSGGTSLKPSGTIMKLPGSFRPLDDDLPEDDGFDFLAWVAASEAEGGLLRLIDGTAGRTELALDLALRPSRFAAR